MRATQGGHVLAWKGWINSPCSLFYPSRFIISNFSSRFPNFSKLFRKGGYFLRILFHSLMHCILRQSIYICFCQVTGWVVHCSNFQRQQCVNSPSLFAQYSHANRISWICLQVFSLFTTNWIQFGIKILFEFHLNTAPKLPNSQYLISVWRFKVFNSLKELFIYLFYCYDSFPISNFSLLAPSGALIAITTY